MNSCGLRNVTDSTMNTAPRTVNSMNSCGLRNVTDSTMNTAPRTVNIFLDVRWGFQEISRLTTNKLAQTPYKISEGRTP